jgi:hypothetical protein
MAAAPPHAAPSYADPPPLYHACEAEDSQPSSLALLSLVTAQAAAAAASADAAHAAAVRAEGAAVRAARFDGTQAGADEARGGKLPRTPALHPHTSPEEALARSTFAPPSPPTGSARTPSESTELTADSLQREGSPAQGWRHGSLFEGRRADLTPGQGEGINGPRDLPDADSSHVARKRSRGGSPPPLTPLRGVHRADN